MPRFCLSIAFLLAAMTLTAGQENKRPSGKKPAEPKTIPGVEVRLRFSVEELDPLKPDKNYLECIVRNKADRSIQVPTVYTGGHNGDISLRAKERFGLRLIFWAGKEKQVHKLLKPGEEITVFKDSLANVFLLDMDKDKPLKPREERFYWTWEA